MFIFLLYFVELRVFSEIHLSGSRLYGMVLVNGMADSCLYNKQNNTWALGDMEFIFSCSHSISLTRSLRSLVRYRCEHSKINSISPRAHVLFSIYFVRTSNFGVETGRSYFFFRFEPAINQCEGDQETYQSALFAVMPYQVAFHMVVRLALMPPNKVLRKVLKVTRFCSE